MMNGLDWMVVVAYGRPFGYAGSSSLGGFCGSWNGTNTRGFSCVAVLLYTALHMAYLC